MILRRISDILTDILVEPFPDTPRGFLRLNGTAQSVGPDLVRTVEYDAIDLRPGLRSKGSRSEEEENQETHDLKVGGKQIKSPAGVRWASIRTLLWIAGGVCRQSLIFFVVLEEEIFVRRIIGPDFFDALVRLVAIFELLQVLHYLRRCAGPDGIVDEFLPCRRPWSIVEV